MTPDPVVMRVITRLNIGGPARQAFALTKQLPDFESFLVAGHPCADEGEMHDPDVAVQYAPLMRSVRPVVDAAALRHLRRVMHRRRPAIVHTHLAKAGAVGRMAACTIRPRPLTVHTFHGHVLDGYFSPAMQRVFIEVERRLARSTDLLFTVSPLVRDSLLDLGIGREAQYRVVPIGIDLRAFSPAHDRSGLVRATLGIPSDAPLIGVIGRLVPIKDVGTLIEAMAWMPGVHLAVVGDGESRLALERLASARSVRGRIHFLGWRSDIASLLGEFDVVALSSRNEGTPVALIEALASGVPVVATRVGGVPDVVDDGITGFLVRPGDPAALAAALTHLLSDSRMRHQFGREGRTRMNARFSLQRFVGEVAQQYCELLETQVCQAAAC